MWTGALAHRLTLEDIARLMSQKPAELAGLGGRKGAIAGGYDADMTIFDPEALTRVEGSSLFTRHSVTPYADEDTNRQSACNLSARKAGV